MQQVLRTGGSRIFMLFGFPVEFLIFTFMLRIKPYLFVFGLLTTILIVNWPVSSANGSSFKQNSTERKSARFQLAYSASVPVPFDNKQDSDYPEIKSNRSYDQAQTPICVRASQNLYYLFEISKTEIRFEESQPQFNIALHPFYTTLFKSIISPNAP